MSLETLGETPPPLAPPSSSSLPKAWEKWVGTEGKRLIIFTGCVITLSGSHWWWVLKELWVISKFERLCFPGLCFIRPLFISLDLSSVPSRGN